jgi:hypothetical protein
VECSIDIRITLEMVPSLNSIGRCCCTRTRPRVNSDPNFLDFPKRRLLAYLQEFDRLAQFGHSSVSDRLNCGSSESQRTCAVAPKSKRQTMSLDRRLSSLEPHVSITRDLCRSPHICEHHSRCGRVRSGQIWRVNPRSPKSNQTCGTSLVSP